MEQQQRPILQSAASWDELDFTSKKRSTRKHAHFATTNNSTNDSACKKQRGTPLRKSIFTPIKQQQRVNDEDTTTMIQKPKANKRSIGTCTTACSTLALDESTDHSVDSGTANFRFTSFPASLPRIHHYQYHNSNNNVSGLHGSYHQDDPELYYSGDDEDHHTADDSTVTSSILGTPVARLNFASAIMPSASAPRCTYIDAMHGSIISTHTFHLEQWNCRNRLFTIHLRVSHLPYRPLPRTTFPPVITKKSSRNRRPP